MKYEEVYGNLEYNKEQYLFYIKDSSLLLLPKNDKEVLLTAEKFFNILDSIGKYKMAENINLKGKTSNQKNIVINVNEVNSEIYGYLRFRINYFCISDNCFETINSCTFSGDIISEFFLSDSIKEKYIKSTTYKIEEKQTFEIFNIPSQEIGRYTYQNNEIKITSIFLQNQYFPPKITSELNFTFINSINIELITDIFVQLNNFFVYKNNGFSSTVNNFIHGKTNEDEYIEIKIFVFEVFGNKELVENNSLSIDDFDDKFCELLEIIASNELYIDNIGNEGNGIIYANSISPHFSAFERNLDLMYPDQIIRGKEFIDAKKQILEFLNSKISSNTGKTKKAFKEFEKFVKNLDTNLSEKFKKVINDNIELMKPYIIRLYDDNDKNIISDIGKELNEMRNVLMHGRMEFYFNEQSMNAFEILKIINIFIPLIKVNLSVPKIKKIINTIMGY